MIHFASLRTCHPRSHRFNATVCNLAPPTNVVQTHPAEFCYAALMITEDSEGASTTSSFLFLAFIIVAVVAILKVLILILGG